MFCSVRRARGHAALSELVVIMDKKLQSMLPPQIQGVLIQKLAEEIGFHHTSFTKPGRLRRELLWQFRIKLTSALLNGNVGFIMNDLDAIWLRDPNQLIFKKLPPNTDIIAHRIQTPKEIVRLWGAAIGTSFIFFKSSNATRNFMNAVEKHWLHDSKATDSPAQSNRWINYALQKVDIKWPDGRKIRPSGRVIGHVPWYNLAVALLTPLQVSRNVCGAAVADKVTVVQTCYMKEPGTLDRMIALVRQGTWHLDQHTWFKSRTKHEPNFSNISTAGATRESAWTSVLSKVVPKQNVPAIAHKLGLLPKQRQTSALGHLVKRARQVAPAPLILVMASSNYIVSCQRPA